MIEEVCATADVVGSEHAGEYVGHSTLGGGAWGFEGQGGNAGCRQCAHVEFTVHHGRIAVEHHNGTRDHV